MVCKAAVRLPAVTSTLSAKRAAAMRRRDNNLEYHTARERAHSADHEHPFCNNGAHRAGRLTAGWRKRVFRPLTILKLLVGQAFSSDADMLKIGILDLR